MWSSARDSKCKMRMRTQAVVCVAAVRVACSGRQRAGAAVARGSDSVRRSSRGAGTPRQGRRRESDAGRWDDAAALGGLSIRPRAGADAAEEGRARQRRQPLRREPAERGGARGEPRDHRDAARSRRRRQRRERRRTDAADARGADGQRRAGDAARAARRRRQSPRAVPSAISRDVGGRTESSGDGGVSHLERRRPHRARAGQRLGNTDLQRAARAVPADWRSDPAPLCGTRRMPRLREGDARRRR